jgi:hypothetical protein
MPPPIVRCEYGPENFAAYALGSGCGAPLASPSSVMVGTVMTGPSGVGMIAQEGSTFHAGRAVGSRT